MTEIRVSRIEAKLIEYQWKKARPDPQSFDPNQRYRLIITYNLMYVPHYVAFKWIIGIDQVIIGAGRRALRTNSSDKDVNSQFPVFLGGGSYRTFPRAWERKEPP